MNTRTERDSLGEFSVPADALYGVQTARAVDNFPISGLRAFPVFIDAIVTIKKAAALANRELERLDARRADAIVAAAEEILGGEFRDQFVVDVFQAGAGTSLHMNVNEVLANRANQILADGENSVHPNDHVNMAQSTNDVIPTAMRLAALALAQPVLIEMNRLAAALGQKAREFDDVLKSGRTHLQDAVPIRLGQEFGAYRRTVEKQAARFAHAAKNLNEIGIGGTATGTGLNAGPEYRRLVVGNLRRLWGLNGIELRAADDPVELMQSQAAIAEISAALRNLALELTRIANDLRLLSSGPRTGLGEIRLPPVQPGSSIMPGKVNPVMAEMLNMVCYQIIGCDAVIAAAVQAGQLELNVMMPIMAWNLLFAETILANCLRVFTDKCVAGIVADPAQCRHFLDRSVGLATLLNPKIGYSAAAEIAKESEKTGRSIRELVRERGLMTEAEMDELIAATRQT